MTQAVFITIGEAPRKDIEETYLRYFEGDEGVAQIGLLDGLSVEEAEERLGRRDEGGPALTSRFLDGTPIVMDPLLVEEALQHRIEEQEAGGAEVIAILCTGSFESLSAQTAEVVEADKVTVPYVKEEYPGKRIGVLVPLREQIPEAREKWHTETAVFEAASPYAFDEKELLTSCSELVRRGAEVLVLDCMGYSEQMKRLAAKHTGVPVVQSNDVLFRYVQEKIKN